VVSDAVRHLSAQVHGSARLGRSATGGIRDPAAGLGRHLGHHAGVCLIRLVSFHASLIFCVEYSAFTAFDAVGWAAGRASGL